MSHPACDFSLDSFSIDLIYITIHPSDIYLINHYSLSNTWYPFYGTVQLKETTLKNCLQMIKTNLDFSAMVIWSLSSNFWLFSLENLSGIHSCHLKTLLKQLQRVEPIHLTTWWIKSILSNKTKAIRVRKNKIFSSAKQSNF